jgi:hypothetical protein
LTSEYDPIGGREGFSPEGSDLDQVRGLFETAGSSYLRSPWSWVAWAAVLPAAALLTPAVHLHFGALAVLLLWSLAILVGGVIEAVVIARGGGSSRRTPLSRWVLRGQANLSLVAFLLSLVLLWKDQPQLLPGLWLLLVGHSFYSLGGVAFPPLRVSALVYQAGGLISFLPGVNGLYVFALTAALGNIWMGWAVWRRNRRLRRQRR